MLECFTSSSNRVHFFNATSLFLHHEAGTEHGTDKYLVNSFLFSDGLHTNGIASRLWGRSMAIMVLELSKNIR